MRTMWLTLAILPYLVFAGYDGWIHERGRQVPRLEQWLHLGLALSLVAFLTFLLLEHTRSALAAFALFLVFQAWDAFGFHARLSQRERMVHAAANLCLISFLMVWLLLDVLRA